MGEISQWQQWIECTLRWVEVDGNGYVQIRDRQLDRLNMWQLESLPATLPEYLDEFFESEPEVFAMSEVRWLGRDIWRLVVALSHASWSNLVRQGLVDPVQSRPRMVAPVFDVLRRHLLPIHDVICERLRKDVYPFDGRKRPACFWRYFAGAPSREIHLHRRQAFAAMPALTHRLSKGELPITAMAVDQALPVIEVLAQELEVPRWVAARLTAAPLPAIKPPTCRGWNEWINENESPAVAGVIEALGPDCAVTRPGLMADWGELAMLAYATRNVFNRYRCLPFVHVEQDMWLARRSLGKTPMTASGNDLGHGKELARLEGAASWVSLYFCVARESIRHHLHSIGQAAGSAEAILAKWLEKLTLKQLLKYSERMAALLREHCKGRYPNWLHCGLDEVVPARIAGHTCDVTGVAVRPLVSRRDMEVEGQQMQHCVGSYWELVVGGEVHLFSLVVPETGIRATLRLYRGVDGAWRIGELKGMKNAAVRNACLKQAAERLCKRLQAGTSRHVAKLDSLFDVADPEVSPDESNAMQATAEILALQKLPVGMLNAALACYPGKGLLESRIDWVREKLMRTMRVPK